MSILFLQRTPCYDVIFIQKYLLLMYHRLEFVLLIIYADDVRIIRLPISIFGQHQRSIGRFVENLKFLYYAWCLRRESVNLGGRRFFGLFLKSFFFDFLSPFLRPYLAKSTNFISFEV
jgi:hypothetical protein